VALPFSLPNIYSDYQNNVPLIEPLNEVRSRGAFLTTLDPQVINRNIFLIITIITERQELQNLIVYLKLFLDLSINVAFDTVFKGLRL
jgi:hypothetical protein